MRSSLVSRLEDIPGVASVVVDLEGFGRGIDVRLEPGADEVAVMEQMHALLAAYGIKDEIDQPVATEAPTPVRSSNPGVEVRITQADGRARVEVTASSVRSFRVVSATPLAIAQGLADAWCQVVGLIPVEILEVVVDGEENLVLRASDGEKESESSAPISGGWVKALTDTVGDVIGVVRRTQARSVDG